ncbi:hypothetical protein [Alkalicoccus saliphilus]|uniref:hypothetical protein n=1 Tax=Alkalicoccus saliphilus TaxID=200989 RepID=UPI00135752B5|nr:hypothetical protein [Alkalicoccus saliphilus]
MSTFYTNFKFRRKLVEKREGVGVLFAVGRISAVVGSITRKVGTIPGRVESIPPLAGRIPAPPVPACFLPHKKPASRTNRGAGFEQLVYYVISIDFAVTFLRVEGVWWNFNIWAE